MVHSVDLLFQFKNASLFQGLNLGEIALLSSIAEEKVFEGGEMLVRQFDDKADVMVILSGAARITTFSGELISEAGSGSTIGEIALLDEKPRSATATANGTTKVAILPKRQLEDLMNREPNIGKTLLRNVGRILCSRLRATNVQLDMLMNCRTAEV